MKTKREYIILIAVIIVLAVVYGLQQYTARKKADILPQTPVIAAEDLTRMEIKTPETELVLGRAENGQWVILPYGYPVEERLSSIMAHGLANFKVTAIISESAQDYPRYQLDDARKVSVKAFANDKLVRDMDLGAVVAGNLRHNYVKLAGDPNVYHGRGNLRTFFDTDEFELREKQILKFDKDAIDEIVLTTATGQRVVQSRRTQDVDGNQIKIWLGADEAYIDSGLVDNFLNFVAQTNVYEFLPPEGQDFGEAAYTLNLIDYDNAKEHVLKVYGPAPGQEDEDEYSVMYNAESSDVLSPFQMAFAQQSDILKRFSDMLKPETNAEGEEKQLKVENPL